MPSTEPNKPDKQKKPVIVRKKRMRRSNRLALPLGKIALKTSQNRSDKPGLFAFTMQVLYKNLYVLGILLIRRTRRFTRRSGLVFTRFRGTTHAWAEKAHLFFEKIWTGMLQQVRMPFERISDTYRERQPFILAHKEQGHIPWDDYKIVAESVLRLLIKIFATVFNYVAPLVAAYYLITTIGSYTNQPLALEVEYKGQPLGYISNESEFESAVQVVNGRLTQDATNAEVFKLASPVFKLESSVPKYKLLDANTLADKLIRSSGGHVEQALGFYVNNRFYGALTNADNLLETMAKIKNENSSGKPNERIEFVKKIALRPALYPSSSLVNEQSLIDLITSNESVEKVYTVQEKDSPSLIADKQDIPYSKLLALNPGIEENLMVGDELLIAAAQPFLSVKRLYTEEYEEEYPFETVEIKNATYARGYRDVVQEGKPGVRRIRAEITTINGIEVGREILETQDIRKPVDERVIVGVNNPATIPSQSIKTDMTPKSSTSSTGFIWPTTGGYAKTYPGHTGNAIDIAIGPGVPIYASAAGTVVKVKYSLQGYGNHLIIDHGNGYQTLYAHNSAMYVSVGDRVAQGQVIAAMGRTGWATGNHLHFEIRYNGRYMWPPDFVGYSR